MFNNNKKTMLELEERIWRLEEYITSQFKTQNENWGRVDSDINKLKKLCKTTKK